MSDARWAALEASCEDRPVREHAEAWVAEELQLIEATETVKAWADAQALASLSRLHRATEMVVQELADDRAFYNRNVPTGRAVHDETVTASVDEVVLATGMPDGRVHALLDLALDAGGDQRCTPMLQALAEGRVSLFRALRVHSEVKDLDPEDARAVCARLLTTGPDGTVPSHQWFTRQLRRQVVLHAIDPAQQRADSIERRDVYGRLEQDGSGSITVVGDGGRLTSALDRVDGLARAARQAGDGRTLPQLRSDLALDLLLYGWADPDRVPEAARNTFVGQPPTATVSMVVHLSTMLGLDNRPGEIVGHGFVSAAHARQMACATGSVWRRLVIDPVDGTALELSTTRYRPTAAIVEQVAARDGMCQAPGCTVPAARCDVDHERPWPAGETALGNLTARHRRHHNHKTRGTWTIVATDDPRSDPAAAEGDQGQPHARDGDRVVRSSPTGSVQWRTVGGREYLVQRHRYDDPTSTPVIPAEVSAAEVDLPPPF